jgi:hypothetical protein
VEAEVVTDRKDLERFKDKARTIRTVLLVRTLAELLWFLLELLEYYEILRPLLFHVQSLAERAQARTGLLREAANAHAKTAAAHEAKLQAEVASACEIQRVKEAMARKDADDDLKQKLEDGEREGEGRGLRPPGRCRGYALVIALGRLHVIL